MKIFVCCIMILSILVGFALPCTAEQTAWNWYPAKAQNGERPQLFPEFSCINEHRVSFIGPENQKTIYLTFDLGYVNENVIRILDILKEKDIPAAFFVLSHVVSGTPDVIKRIDREGHLVCNHTAHHKDMSKCQREEFVTELNLLAEQVSSLLGHDVAPFYRPPEGKFSEENLVWAEELGYTTVFWSLAYADWDEKQQPEPKKSIEKLCARSHPGMVLLLHPTSRTNADILSQLIDRWRNEGYRFGTLNELTNEMSSREENQ